MVTYLEVAPDALIDGIAAELKNKPQIKAPVWTIFVKTSANKEQPPANSDWWHIRAAAILRKVAVYGPLGTNKLKVMYGGKQRRGHKKPVFVTGSGNIARKCLQQLEAAGLVKHEIVGTHKGRSITPAGVKLLDSIAYKIAKATPAQKQ